ncbi:cytochrome P450 [Xylaria telfairii]|nr:cytochrome P450 [Xylaria telfairii]
MEASINPYWIVPVILLCYYLMDTVGIWKSTQNYPIAGDLSALAPRFVLNFHYSRRLSRLCRDSYQKFKDQPIQFIRTDGNVVVLPYNVLAELSTLPTTIASPTEALVNEFGKSSVMNLMLHNTLHHSVLQRRLTPKLPVLTPILEKIVTSAYQECFPQADDWVEVIPYSLFKRITAQVTASVLVGPSISQDPEWLDASFDLTELAVQTRMSLSIVPYRMQSIVSLFLPSYWKSHRCAQRIREILSPKIQELLEANDSGAWNLTDSTEEEDTNTLSWLVGSTKGRERNPVSIANALVVLVISSTHTTLSRVLDTMYDIMAADKSQDGLLTDELRTEIEAVAVDAKGWSDMPYDRLHKLDSTLRESLRTSPTNHLGMKRLFKKPHTFRNGIRVPEGTYTAMMISEIMNDPEHTPNPEVFDALRSYREKQTLGLDNPTTKDFDFSAASRISLGFGYGRTACPGRFFASLVIKMVFVKLLTEYDLRFLPGEDNHQAIYRSELVSMSPTQKILVRRRAGNNCPY